MSNKSVGVFLGFVFVALLAGCVKTVETKKPGSPINKVALVSFSVGTLKGTAAGMPGPDAKAAELVNSTLANLLAETENKLSGIMQVTKISSFAKNKAFLKLASKSKFDIMVPKVSGGPLTVFASNNDELIAAKIPPDVAKKLCATLKVDAVVVVYSEWSESTVPFESTRNALAKNVVSVWDRNGDIVFTMRVEKTGEGVLGESSGSIVVNEGTVKQWSGAYLKGFDQIAQEMKATLKP